jgi:asparagine synthase (glutamine-hydrolysing)
VLARLPEAVEQMAEPMVGQDAVAFYLLSEQVAKCEGGAERPGRRRESSAATTGIRACTRKPLRHAPGTFPPALFRPGPRRIPGNRDPAFHGLDHTAFTVSARLTEPDADTFIDQVLRMDTTMLITDDPVKRVDNMTMAWGLEARVPFLDHELVELAARMPPELKLASGGKHILKSIARGLVPDGDRPEKGLFPDAGPEVRARRVPRIHAPTS